MVQLYLCVGDNGECPIQQTCRIIGNPRGMSNHPRCQFHQTILPSAIGLLQQGPQRLDTIQ